MDCDTNLRVHERWRNIKQCREDLSHLSGIRSPIFLKLQILRLTCSFDLSRSSEFSAFGFETIHVWFLGHAWEVLERL